MKMTSFGTPKMSLGSLQRNPRRASEVPGPSLSVRDFNPAAPLYLVSSQIQGDCSHIRLQAAKRAVWRQLQRSCTLFEPQVAPETNAIHVIASKLRKVLLHSIGPGDRCAKRLARAGD